MGYAGYNDDDDDVALNDLSSAVDLVRACCCVGGGIGEVKSTVVQNYPAFIDLNKLKLTFNLSLYGLNVVSVPQIPRDSFLLHYNLIQRLYYLMHQFLSVWGF